jgi:hypothetical protein
MTVGFSHRFPANSSCSEQVAPLTTTNPALPSNQSSPQPTIAPNITIPFRIIMTALQVAFIGFLALHPTASVNQIAKSSEKFASQRLLASFPANK